MRAVNSLAVLCLLFLAACAAPIAATEAVGFASDVPQATPTGAAETPLPTSEPSATAFPEGLWVGLPSYPGDSLPDTAFQVTFDPESWTLAADPTGVLALLHRQIPGCQIVPIGGRGLPPGLTVSHDYRRIGSVEYEVNLVTGADGSLQFVTYLGGDASIFTGFEVDFTEQANDCRLAAEIVLGTLTSVPAPLATATPAELSPEVTPTP